MVDECSAIQGILSHLFCAHILRCISGEMRLRRKFWIVLFNILLIFIIVLKKAEVSFGSRV